jgi:transcription elongation GreA/GreB family factor
MWRVVSPSGVFGPWFVRLGSGVLAVTGTEPAGGRVGAAMTAISIETTRSEVRELRARIRDQMEGEYLQLCSVDRPALVHMLRGEIAGPDAAVARR